MNHPHPYPHFTHNMPKSIPTKSLTIPQPDIICQTSKSQPTPNFNFMSGLEDLRRFPKAQAVRPGFEPQCLRQKAYDHRKQLYAMLTASLPSANLHSLIHNKDPSTERFTPAHPPSYPPAQSTSHLLTFLTPSSTKTDHLPNPPKPPLDLSSTRFGSFGGQFAPELQIEALHSLASTFQSTITTDSFWQTYHAHTPFCPTPLHLAKNLTHRATGATIWLKREDRNPYRSHRARSIVGQILFAKRLGRREIVTDCGSACHGIACAGLCAQLGLKCTVYMGVDDAARQCAGVLEMQQLGADVVPVETGAGCRTLKAAVNSAIAHSLEDQEGVYYVMGGPIGAHPFPVINRTFQAGVGEEVKVQLARVMGREEDGLPDALVSPLGVGAAATGLFGAFAAEKGVRMVGVEAEGAAPLSGGSVGVLHGCRTMVLQDEDGQIESTQAMSPDMNFPSVGPELAHWKGMQRVEVSAASDEEALEGVRILAEEEDVVAGLSTGYAVAETMRLARELGPGQNVVLLVTGKDDVH
ncbi:tryptophan synthase beta subunit-like PLP-dependent enzyme [Aspergillus steynii IBT 23096]|uniref:tryptophan synthase n=1 Tax=Aspergillus steynii IBT 23096 TaxID=1392250 RepID=A0A2I2GB13_9EURO|nr:tryptophan synthase beta subunit-like PLP-dependent enzyme [Aspergillus steynii IBT 23096]PLB50072.1 tryptophan synthase beta subunit-like PLP-dependent enzyme [Aspergillus steynii IBT 23096]